jgi:predicted PurR-regulated permease PerM
LRHFILKKSLNSERLNCYKEHGKERMKRLLAAGIILVLIFLALSAGTASIKEENATNNMTLPDNIELVSDTNLSSIQNNSLNVIIIKNMTEIINIIMPQNMTNATETMIGLQNIISSLL